MSSARLRFDTLHHPYGHSPCRGTWHPGREYCSWLSACGVLARSWLAWEECLHLAWGLSPDGAYSRSSSGSGYTRDPWVVCSSFCRVFFCCVVGFLVLLVLWVL